MCLFSLLAAGYFADNPLNLALYREVEPITRLGTHIPKSRMYSALLLHLASALRKVQFDYTPQWGRGTPDTVIESVTFPCVLADKEYTYRVVVDNTDLGVRRANSVQVDGSQMLNLLEWNKGSGIRDRCRIRVYVVEPDTGSQYLVAQWK